MKSTIDAIRALATMLLTHKVRHAVKYLGHRLTVKATRQGTWTKRDSRRTMLITVGQPNHRERRFIRACRQAKEPFPVKKIQVHPL